MSEKRVKVLRITVIAAGVILVGIGLWQGQYGAVLQKAVRICLECIGIG